MVKEIENSKWIEIKLTISSVSHGLIGIKKHMKEYAEELDWMVEVDKEGEADENGERFYEIRALPKNKFISPEEYRLYTTGYQQAAGRLQEYQRQEALRKQRRIESARRFLETQPRMLFERAIAGARRPSRRRAYRGMFGDVWSEYQAELASQALKGVKPEALPKFGGFLSGYPMEQKYMALPPGERGYGRVSRYQPRTRFLNF